MRGDPFHSVEMELPEFTAVLDEMTKNTYVLVIVHDMRIGELAVGRWPFVLMWCWIRWVGWGRVADVFGLVLLVVYREGGVED